MEQQVNFSVKEVNVIRRQLLKIFGVDLITFAAVTLNDEDVHQTLTTWS